MLKVYQMNIAPLRDEAAFSEKLHILPAECRDRITAYRQTDDRCRSLGAWSLLYEGLLELGITPGEIEITRGGRGKPYLSRPVGEPSLYFSLSHSKDMAVCVISDREVGCDIEELDRFSDKSDESLRRIARRVMTEEEYELWQKEPTGEELVMLWTRKESYAKYTGEGLSCDFSSVDTINSSNYSHPDTEKGYCLAIFT